MGAPHRSTQKTGNPQPPPGVLPAGSQHSPAAGPVPRAPRDPGGRQQTTVPREPGPAAPAAPGGRPRVQGNPPAASRPPLRRLSAAAPARRAPATAQAVVAALALPPPPPAAHPARPLPLASLDQLPRDASMLYEIARVDASGRVANRDMVRKLGWQAGDKLEMILAQGAVIIRPSPDGSFSLPQRPRIIIPLAARKRHAIGPGDHVLVAAAPDYAVLIIYPVPTLNEMIARHHSAKPPSEPPRP